MIIYLARSCSIVIDCCRNAIELIICRKRCSRKALQVQVAYDCHKQASLDSFYF